MILGSPSPKSRGLTDTASTKPAILFIAGFGDDASMFEGLLETRLAQTHQLMPINLPGFGARASGSITTLDSLAHFVAEKANEVGATVIVAHSVASIIASLAAKLFGCPVTTIISLEGNITADDAYFSGTAADYDDPDKFRKVFLNRLDKMATTKAGVTRYRQAVSRADPLALWQLGTDARHFSDKFIPGAVLAQSARVTYIYNPQNCPDTTLRWLEKHAMDRIVLDDASHWPSVDQPEKLADTISKILTNEN